MLFNKFYQTLVNDLDYGVVVLDAEDRVCLWDPWMSRNFGRSEEMAEGHPIGALLPQAMVQRAEQGVRDAVERGLSSIVSHSLTPKNTRPLNHSLVISPLGPAEARGCLIQVKDASERIAAEHLIDEKEGTIEEQKQEITRRNRELLRASYFDAVTGLANRTMFREHLARALHRTIGTDQIGAVVLFDVDNFKGVNDSLGADAADVILKEIGHRVANTVRQVDTVARLSADEFVVILDGIERPEDALLTSLRVLQNVYRPFETDQDELFISLSAGITIFPVDGEDPDDLIKNADTAMQKAKEMGRNNAQLYSAKMNDRATERLSMQGDLRRAFDKGGFELYYQPQLDLRTGRVIGAEALLRWIDSKRGFVSPAEFVPVMEECGLIMQVGAWVLQTACQEVRKWQLAKLPPLRVAVNLSAHQFRTRELITTVSKALEDAGVEPQSLELELTEGLVMNDVQASLSMLEELKKMGTHIAVDDFGTGYSSLSYLKKFPVDTLKIDRAFIRELMSISEDRAISQAVIGMGHALELEVVAEGVEDEEQLQWLKQQGCDLIQGYHLGRPMPAMEFIRWMQKRQNEG